MVRVKICGITNVGDALVAVKAGADALGFLFWEGSARFVDPLMAKAIIAALPPFVARVGVFVDEPPDSIREIAATTGIDVVQLHGNEKPQIIDALKGLRVVKAFRVASEQDLAKMTLYRVDAFLLDAFVRDKPGGTGQTFDWEIARQAALNGPVILAGGLTPDNVADAVRQARPYAVDVSSGVEMSPGKKDKTKVREFIRIAKSVALY